METIENELLDHVAEAIEEARCPHRRGPYGLFDYTSRGHPKPFHVRDFRDPNSDSWGVQVAAFESRVEAEILLDQLTGRHIAQAAITAIRAFG